MAEPIGQGAMGVVWRAHDQLLDREVAVKQVLLSAPIGQLDEADPYQRTMDEARNAARLSHPGIVTVHDVVEEDGRPWIVMELVPSITLERLISAQGPMTALRTGRIGRQLLAALSAAHAAGVLHRDVKPSNILIARARSGENLQERAVLTDFGISRLEGNSQRTQSGLVMGSPGYVAPERVNGSVATAASDLWSLGATLYAAVEGRGPFERQNLASTLSAIVNEDAPPATSAGRLAPFIAALMRREPTARPSAAEAAAMLAKILRLMDDRTAPSVAAAEPDPIRAVRMIPDEIDEIPDTRTLPGARKRRIRIAPVRVPKLILILIPTAFAIAAILAGIFLHLRPTPHANTLREASPPTTTSPTGTGTGTELPPVSSAPDVVRAIDTPNNILPPGYLTQRVRGAQAGKTNGFNIDTPPGWQAHVMGQQTYRYTPNGGVTYVEIDLTRHAKSSMVAEAQYLSAQDRAEFPDYQPIHSASGQPRKKYIQPENILQTAGALWQFDWVNKRVKMRVDVLLFNVGQQSYTITMTAPAGTDDGNWNDRVLPSVAIMLHTFKPVS